jgi:hypothetical protein
MGYPAVVSRLQIHRRWRNLVVVALFAAIVFGLATALVAGARRSASVVHRYFDATIPYDLTVGGLDMRQSALRAIPGVARADRDTYFGSTLVERDGSLGGAINGLVYDRSAIDPTIRVLAGRLPDADDASAVLVNEEFVRAFGRGPGDTLTVKTFAPGDRSDVEANRYDHPHGPMYRFRIAALIRTPLDIALDQPHALSTQPSISNNGMFVPAAFYNVNHTDFLGFGDAYDVELAPSTNRRAFEAAVRRTFGDDVYFGPARFAARRDSFTTPVDLETTGLLALGVATATAGAIVVALLLAAEQRAHQDDDDLLRALGATRRGVATVAVLRTAPFAAAGAVLAVVLACALSPRFPIGVGRQLELDRGFDVNVAVVTAATALVVVFVTAVAGVVAGRAPRHARANRLRGRGGIASVLARNRAPVEVVVGTDFAFGSEPERRSPNRPAIIGGALALAIILSLGVVVAAVDHVYVDRVAHGFPWDAAIGNTNFTMSKARENAIVHDGRVRAATRGRYGQATLGGRSVELLAYDPRGGAPPEVLRGRLPTHADEVAPGAKLLRELHAHIGSRVTLSVANSEFASPSQRPVDRDLTVVGVSIPPIMGESEFGEAAVVPRAAIKAAGGSTAPQLVLVRLRGDRITNARGLARDYTPEIMLDNVPARVVNLHRVLALPALGALLAAVFGTVLLAYTLAVSVRHRIRQLGVLRALGMTTRRVGRVLVCQGAALALAIALAGIPLGLVFGVVAWRTFAHSLGVVSRATIPWTLLLLVPGSIAVGVLAAVVPARRSRRQPVSELLRVE